MIIINEIKREYMPQIRGKDIKEMLKIFNDYDISYKLGNIMVKNLKPTQDNAIPNKINNIVKGMMKDKRIDPLLVSKDFYIIDGHHRWLAIKRIWGSEKRIPVIQIKYDKKDSLKLVNNAEKIINK